MPRTFIVKGTATKVNMRMAIKAKAEVRPTIAVRMTIKAVKIQQPQKDVTK